MKKIILVAAMVLGFALAASAQQYRAGVRVGSGFQAQAEYNYAESNYFEARFGMSWCNFGGFLTADFTVLHNWNVMNMDWTPSVGQWFFDAGAGINVGGRAHYATVGVAGIARLGIEFNDVPIRVSVDYTPVFGPEIIYGKGYSAAAFNEYGLANLGLSAVFTF